MGAPLGSLEGGLSTGDLCVEEGPGDGHLFLYRGPVENNGGGGFSSLGTLRES